RPTAKDLLRHRFIRNARNTSSLQELVERYDSWKISGSHRDPSMTMQNRISYASWDFETIKQAYLDGTLRLDPEASRDLRQTLVSLNIVSSQIIVKCLILSHFYDDQASVSSKNSTVKLSNISRNSFFEGFDTGTVTGTSSNIDVTENNDTIDLLNVNDGLDTVRAPRPFSVNLSTSNRSSVVSLSMFPRNIPVVEPVTEEGIVGRQLVDQVIIPSIEKIKSNELRANDIEALSLFEKGIEELGQTNPDLVITTLTEILSRLKINIEICEKLSDLGVVSEAFLETPELSINATSSSSSQANDDDSSSIKVSSEKIDSNEPEEKPKSGISEMLYVKWIEQLRMKWPIGFGSSS
ncbi:11169_t:CDS:2, partial [Acaulospora colombiana]